MAPLLSTPLLAQDSHQDNDQTLVRESTSKDNFFEVGPTLGVHSISAKGSNNNKIDMDNMVGLGGFMNIKVMDFLRVGGDIDVSATSRQEDIGGVKVQSSLTNSRLGANVKYSFIDKERFCLWGKAGFAHHTFEQELSVKSDYSYANYSEKNTASTSSNAIGFGADFNVTKLVSLGGEVEHRRYNDFEFRKSRSKFSDFTSNNSVFRVGFHF